MKAIYVLVVFLLFLSCSFFAKPTFAALYVNEFSSDTEGTISDPDWVEIYNSGPDSVDLSIYRFRDNTATNKKDLSGIIGVGNFEVFDWSNKLNKSGDIIKLLLISDESIIDQVGYGDQGNDVFAPSVGQSAGRQPDGSSSWTVFTTSTKKSSNNTSSLAPTPTLSPSPTPISIPTSKPASTKSPTKAPVTSAPTQKISSPFPSTGQTLGTATSTRVNVPTSVLGQSTRSAVATSSADTTDSNKEVKTLGSSQNNIFRILAVTGIAIFVFSCATLLFQHFKNKKINNE